MNKKVVKQSPFNFLKGGKDEQFDNAMKSMDNLYDDMFGDSSKYDSIFQTFKTQNNPITESIEQMTRQIFDLDAPKDQNYIKVEKQEKKNIMNRQAQIQQDEQQNIVFGQPCYIGEVNKNPYFQNQFHY